MNSKRYSIVYTPQIIDAEMEDSPFRLKNDIKLHNISEEQLKAIAEECANELLYCPRSPISTRGYIRNGISWVKIRIKDISSNRGKSSGYRVVLLDDGINRIGYILHIYKHEKGEKNNIIHNDKNKLNKLVNKYSEQI